MELSNFINFIKCWCFIEISSNRPLFWLCYLIFLKSTGFIDKLIFWIKISMESRKFFHSGAFWTPKLKIFFNHGEVFLYKSTKIIPFWCLLDTETSELFYSRVPWQNFFILVQSRGVTTSGTVLLLTLSYHWRGKSWLIILILIIYLKSLISLNLDEKCP